MMGPVVHRAVYEGEMMFLPSMVLNGRDEVRNAYLTFTHPFSCGRCQYTGLRAEARIDLLTR